jgi:hypothetical protein
MNVSRAKDLDNITISGDGSRLDTYPEPKTPMFEAAPLGVYKGLVGTQAAQSHRAGVDLGMLR